MPALDITLGQPHVDILQTSSRFKVVNAGRGFGKGQLTLARIAKHLGQRYTDRNGQPLVHKVVYCAPDRVQAKNVMWDRLKVFFGPIIRRVNEAELKLTLAGGSTIQLFGTNRWDGMRGAYCTLFIGDEWAFANEPDQFAKVIRPMLDRVQPLGSAEFYSTPDGRNQFYELAQRGQDKAEPDWAYWHHISTDGGFVDPEAVTAARRDMTYSGWRQEYFAEFINPTSLVYYNFVRDKHCKPTPYIAGATIHWAWDFNVAPACHTTLSHRVNGKTYVFDEIAEGNTPVNLDVFLHRYPPHRVAEIKLYGDYNGTIATSGLTDYACISNFLLHHKYPFNPDTDLCVYGANPLVRSRTENANRLFENAQGDVMVQVDPDKCPLLVADFEQVKRKPDGSIDKTSDPTKSHPSDAIGYQWIVTDPPSYHRPPARHPLPASDDPLIHRR